jgi:beta-mannosidase
MKIYVTIIYLICCLNSFGQSSLIKELNKGWKFKQRNKATWHKASIPGTIHTDLLANKLIEDPFYRDNEKKVQWVSHTDWEYKTNFTLSENELKQDSIYIQFEGLDTYADVTLNGHPILIAENMFRTYTLDVKPHLKKTNTLQIVFYSADSIVNLKAQAALPLVRPCENNRHYARKAQYHFGWDWAPKLTTCGIWRPVKLVFGTLPVPPLSQYADVDLVREQDSIGISFYFTVKGQPTFMRGANWIPADVFLPRISKEKYRNLLIAAKEANFNMLRVWGGGIYEDEYFYDLCDSLGLYVWQDFMFAGAMYPITTSNIENLKSEFRDNIIRLRKHPCIVLWCGNNEIDEAWHNWGWQKQFKINPFDSTFLWHEYQQLFQKILPEMLAELDPGRPYLSSSPVLGWGRKESMTIGDSHYWGMWWGMESINVMKQKIPRFMSEYGMQAMPNDETIQEYSIASDWDTASAVMKSHQKHPTGYSTISKYLQMEQIPYNDFKSFVNASQELQSRALQTAIESQINSNGRCMGSLFWQFNDCWPVCSWSVVDYYGRKKKAYYTVKQAFGK